MRHLRTLTGIAAAIGTVLALASSPAIAVDGVYSGASSVAGGTGECWGNAPASAIVSGDSVTIRYVAYDGTQSPVTATLRPDGSFQAAQPVTGGTIAYAGKVTARRLTAQWKGPVCYGTLDMTK